MNIDPRDIGIGIFFPLPLTNVGAVGYTCKSIAAGINSGGTLATIITSRTIHSQAGAPVRATLPSFARYLPYRFIRPFSQRNVERRFVEFMRELTLSSRYCAALLFPDPSLELIRKLRENGVTVFREMINCHRGLAKRVLDDAYARAGTDPAHGITESSVEREREEIHEADYLFCSNPMAERSLREIGVSPSKILNVSYGWDPGRFGSSCRQLELTSGLTVLHVGTVCIRKGAHLLIDYWIKSRVKGRLVFVGDVEPIVRNKLAKLGQQGSSIIILGYHHNVERLYRSADVLAFPTIEEGGPLVTYEACGCGLPVLTTPMGAARIIRDDMEGFILDPYDEDAWVSKLQILAQDKQLRRRLSEAANERAKLFTWPLVSEHRRKLIAATTCAHDREHWATT
jgi:glycosyltransferase involved in cell wall biosynthesis